MAEYGHGAGVKMVYKVMLGEVLARREGLKAAGRENGFDL